MSNTTGSNIQAQDLAYFRQLVKKHELETYRFFIEPLLKRRILVTYEGYEDYSQVGNSRLGGWPDVPADFAWPRDSDGKYLHFVFQLNLADIASMQSILPATGVLQFFLGGEEMDDDTCEYDGCILYHPEKSTLSKYALPENTQLSAYSWEFFHGLVPYFELDMPLMSENAYRAEFYSALSLPDDESKFFPDFEGSCFETALNNAGKWDNYLDLRGDLHWPEHLRDKNLQYLLGYAIWGGKVSDPEAISNVSPPDGDLVFSLFPLLEVDSWPLDENSIDGFGWLAHADWSYEFVVPRKKLYRHDFTEVHITSTYVA